MSDDFIPTRASSRKKNVEKQFTSTTFESYKPKRVRKPTVKTYEIEPKVEELNMRKVKHEIVKFGMSGFDTKKKQEAKIQLAIKLGAKPPRNKNINYKLLIEQRKKEKEAKQSENNFQQLGKNAIGKSTAKGKRFDRNRKKDPKGKGGLLDIYGKVDKSAIKQ